MGRVYENPPIIEALCEFRFEPSQPWDWTIPGLVYAEIKNDFPKKRQQPVAEITLEVQPQGVKNLSSGVSRIHFLREDERALVQIGPNLLIINQLKPYPGWQVFKPTISNVLKVYHQVANPKKIQRIGLRYINIISIPAQQINSGDYINDYLLALPTIPEGVPPELSAWAQRMEIPYTKPAGLMILQSGSAQGPEQASAALMLDLDFITIPKSTMPLDSAMEWVDQTHEKLEITFEACIGEKARALFKEVKHHD